MSEEPGPVEAIEDLPTFVQAVFEEQGPVVVDFWAQWCAPCRAFAPTFEAAAARHPTIRFVKVNTEQHRDIAQAAGIRSLPTIGIYYRGALHDVLIGAQSPPQFEKRLQKLADKAAGKGFFARLLNR